MGDRDGHTIENDREQSDEYTENKVKEILRTAEQESNDGGSPSRSRTPTQRIIRHYHNKPPNRKRVINPTLRRHH